MIKNSRSQVIYILVFVIIVIVYCTGCETKPVFLPNDSFILEKFGNGDAKFYGNNIITGRDGKLIVLGLDGQIKEEYDDINVNWIDGIPDEGLVVYGNFSKETGVIELDENGKYKGTVYCITTEELWIDQTLYHFGDRYYMTATEIEGNINNGDPNLECGNYTIHLFESYDCSNWTWVSDVASENYNLEDVDVLYSDGVLYVCYEKEILDKRESSIVLRYSKNGGKSFSDEVVLLPADCDHEPVVLCPDKEGFTLFYSCDRDNKGQSYMGGKAYIAFFDDSFNCIKKDVEIKVSTNQGIIWYDYMRIMDKDYYLFAGNAITENNMIVEAWQVTQ